MPLLREKRETSEARDGKGETDGRREADTREGEGEGETVGTASDESGQTVEEEDEENDDDDDEEMMMKGERQKWRKTGEINRRLK